MQALWIILKNNWKYIGVAIAILGLYLSATSYIGSIKKQAYNNGVEVTNKQWNNKVAEEERRNRIFEKKLEDIVGGYGERAVVKAAQRMKTSVVEVEKVKTIVHNNTKYQQCKVDDSIIESRNIIRAKGPTGIKQTTPTDNGVRLEF